MELAARHSVPAIYELREFALARGLISYGTGLIDAYRLVGNFTRQILHGSKPAEIPVQRPDKFQPIINLKTAKALGLSTPDKLLARADEVIE